jgi:hypothetical protein
VPLDFFGTADISCTLLPVEFLSFYGEAQTHCNTLNWVTGSELNSSHFVVEHSKNGVAFEAIAQVSAAGMALNGKSYQTKDYKPYEGQTYYRLKQVDIDGKYRYSDVISVHNTKASVFEIVGAYPNPTRDDFNVQVFSPVAGTVRYEVIDIRGTVLLDKSFVSKGGVDQLQIQAGQFGHGVYIVRMTSETSGETDFIRFSVE